MPPFRIEYFCPREAPVWKVYGQWAFGMDFNGCVNTANRLMWQYHSVRVIDGNGNVVYQV